MDVRGLALSLVIGVALIGCSDQPATTTTSAESTAVATAAPARTSPTTAPTAIAKTPAPQQRAQAPTQQSPSDPMAQLRALGISAICNDGTYSMSRTRSGTCSHHGGVRQWTGLI
jgi:hypothetical protein